MRRSVSIKPEPVRFELANDICESLEERVGISAADVGEVRGRVGLAVRSDAEPVRVSFDERRVADRHLDRTDVEDRLGAGLVALFGVGGR